MIEEKEVFNFGSEYSDNFPKILKLLNISLVATSYQSSRLIIIKNQEKNLETQLIQIPRPMGVCTYKDRLILGTLTQVYDFKKSENILNTIKEDNFTNTKNLTKKVLDEELDKEKEMDLNSIKKADSLFIPRNSTSTGMINIHDIAWGKEGLWLVNSTFSCLSTLSSNYSFVARWKPPFISSLVPEDRCHLNGMAMKDGKAKYVTTFNKEDTKDSWSNKLNNKGTLIDIDTNEILLDNLTMPHSPKYHKGLVYLCDSGKGSVISYNSLTKEIKTIIEVEGFTRGLIFYDSLMFVGLSKVKEAHIDENIPLNKKYKTTYSGIYIINLEDNTIISELKFTGDIDQIYDIAILQDTISPYFINFNNPITRHIYDFKESLA